MIINCYVLNCNPLSKSLRKQISRLNARECSQLDDTDFRLTCEQAYKSLLHEIKFTGFTNYCNTWTQLEELVESQGITTLIINLNLLTPVYLYESGYDSTAQIQQTITKLIEEGVKIVVFSDNPAKNASVLANLQLEFQQIPYDDVIVRFDGNSRKYSSERIKNYINSNKTKEKYMLADENFLSMAYILHNKVNIDAITFCSMKPQDEWQCNSTSTAQIEYSKWYKRVIDSCKARKESVPVFKNNFEFFMYLLRGDFERARNATNAGGRFFSAMNRIEKYLRVQRAYSKPYGTAIIPLLHSMGLNAETLSSKAVIFMEIDDLLINENAHQAIDWFYVRDQSRWFGDARKNIKIVCLTCRKTPYTNQNTSVIKSATEVLTDLKLPFDDILSFDSCQFELQQTMGEVIAKYIQNSNTQNASVYVICSTPQDVLSTIYYCDQQGINLKSAGLWLGGLNKTMNHSRSVIS